MDDLLRPVSTSYKTSQLEVVKPQNKVTPASAITTALLSSPDSALEILRSEPALETVRATLCYLLRDAPSHSDFSIASPSPKAAQIVNVLVTEIVPNYWTIFKESARRNAQVEKKPVQSWSEKKLLRSCLRNVAGINALSLRLKALIQQSKESKKQDTGWKITENLLLLLDVLVSVLEDDGESVVFQIWESVNCPEISSSQRKLLWLEFTSMIGGGKILAVAAEAADLIKESSKEVCNDSWIVNGTLYCSWLARNIVVMAKKLTMSQAIGWKSLSELLSKSFRLGHTDSIVQEVISGLLLQRDAFSAQFKELLNNSSNYEQRTVLAAVLRMISKCYLTTGPEARNEQWWKSDAPSVSAAAALISITIDSSSNRRNSLIAWLSSSSGAGSGDPVGVRRAAVVAISQVKDDLETVLENSIAQFGDQLYIKHTPVMQQEVHTQVLLLVAGYVHRLGSVRLHMLLRSGPYLSAISNRLAATSSRARLLGMIVGEALSGLVDKEDQRMKFEMEELESDDSEWYKSLVTVHDSLGSLDLLKSRGAVPGPAKKPAARKAPPPAQTSTSGHSKILAIEEINADEESEDDDLMSYEKPDSDQEDSDEDATLVTRDKPTAPVYIRDLITCLRNTESYNHQFLGLTHASSLIRRKASFGTEVTAHAEELAALLVGLQDKFDIPEFLDLRLQGMIAVVLAQPSVMGPWFAKTFFDGDYSLAQRSSVLTTLSLSARELGGWKDDQNLARFNASASFPSKMLSPRMHEIYASPAQKQLPQSSDGSPIHALSQQLSQTMMAPLAASAADKLSGPSILKVRTFSSRMDVEKARAKPRANALAQMAAEAFFLPLSGRFAPHLRTHGASNIVFAPRLLSDYLRTLSLIMHAAGPACVSLGAITSEFWELLLGLRGAGMERGDAAVIEGILLGFMTIVDINAESGSGSRVLAERYGREMLETRSWVEAWWARMGGGSAEDERLRMLAAAVLVRIGEVVERYQALLVGDLAAHR